VICIPLKFKRVRQSPLVLSGLFPAKILRRLLQHIGYLPDSSINKASGRVSSLCLVLSASFRTVSVAFSFFLFRLLLGLPLLRFLRGSHIQNLLFYNRVNFFLSVYVKIYFRPFFCAVTGSSYVRLQDSSLQITFGEKRSKKSSRCYWL
jgi:hypothetical protein